MTDPRATIANPRAWLFASRTCGALAMITATAAIVGWAGGVTILSSLLHDAIPMAISTAITLVLASAALLLSTTRRWSQVCQRSTGAVLLTTGVLTFADHLIRDGTYLRSIGLLASLAGWVNRLPGEMAPNTAANFILLGVTFLFTGSSSRRRQLAADCSVVLAAVVALIAFIGYLYGVPSFYHAGTFIPMGLNTAIAQLALCAGLLTARPNVGIMAVISRRNAAGYVSRRVLVASMAIPLLVGYAVDRGMSLLYTPQFALSLFTASTIVLMAGLTFFATMRIAYADVKRHLAEHSLRRSTEEFREFVQVTRDAILSFDAAGRVDFANPQAADTFGYRDAPMIGVPAHDLFVSRSERETLLAELERGEEAAGEATGRRLDGTEFPLDLSITRRDAEDGTHYTAALRDVSDRKSREQHELALREQLERVQRVETLGQVAATMAHEFNNVLMGIQPFTDLLERDPTPERRTMAVHHIRESIRRGKRVAEEVLRFARPVPPNFVALDFREWLVAFEREARGIAGTAIEVEMKLPPEGTWVDADAQQIAQVFLNIVVNATHAMPDGGTLTIVAARGVAGQAYSFAAPEDVGRFIHVAIRDTGSGMPAEVRDRIFEPMFTTKRRGSGLGLAVAKKVIADHAGAIFVESAPGQGSAFHLFLPLSRSAASGADTPD